MQRSFPPLRIHLSPSPWLARYIHALHGALLLFCLFLPLPWPWRLLAACAVVIGWRFAWQRHVAGVGESGFEAIEWQSDGDWWLQEGSGCSHPVTLLAGSFVSNWMVVLRFRLGRFRHRQLILLADNTDADQLRRLRVRLRQDSLGGA